MNLSITPAVDHFLEVQDADFYKGGIRMLHDHWTKAPLQTGSRPGLKSHWGSVRQIGGPKHTHRSSGKTESRRLEMGLGAVDDQDVFCVLSCSTRSTMLAETAFLTVGPSIGLVRSIRRSLSSRAGIDNSLSHRGFETRRLLSPGLAGLSKPLPGVWPLSHANSYGEPQESKAEAGIANWTRTQDYDQAGTRVWARTRNWIPELLAT
ncbi:uncharacterized protein [Mobula birostris]|uniref:uncharacterized protein n=1 Tax=Mobula birostris TaxID=1983395 RepID=UPI003B28A703